MKAKLIIDGKEIEVEISDEQAKALTEKPKKKTGYERVERGRIYYRADYLGIVIKESDNRCYYDEDCYNTANYYADKTLAENNARADKLFRQLRRFAVEHREKAIDWNDKNQPKYSIVFDCIRKKTYIGKYWDIHMFKTIYFDSEEAARLASETFKDELMWYFTEYKDSL